MAKILLTLCIIHQDKSILLGMKKTGFGAGRWNGFGGKVEEGETIEEAAKRELEEESSLKAEEMIKRGVLTFEFEQHPEILEVHVFYANSYFGEPKESKEMKPQWFLVNEIPYDNMWSDDKYWLPLLLDGKKFKGTFLFDKPSTKNYSAKIIKKELIEVEEI